MAGRCCLATVVVLLVLPAVCTADTFIVPLDVNGLYDAGQWTPFGIRSGSGPVPCNGGPFRLRGHGNGRP